MADKDTDTNKHIKIGVLICFAVLLFCVVASLSRLHDSVPPRFAPPFATQILCRFEQRQRERVESRSRASGKAMQRTSN